MSPESTHGLSVPRDLVLSVLRDRERPADVRRLRVLAALASQQPARPQKDAA